MSDYVKQFGLNHDPFSATTEYRSFFAGAERENLLQRLVEQANYGSPISVVTGAPGMGKTTLGREFARRFAEEAFCIHVQATLFMTQGQFLDALLEQLPVGASSPDVADIVQDIGQFAERLYLDARTLVLVIDDAHELASEVLDIIDSLTDATTEGAVHVLLLGEAQLGDMLGQVLGERAFGRVIEETLEPVSAAEANAYLRLKLHDAGYAGDMPVSAEEIGLYCQAAIGVPGALNTHFAHMLAESLTQKKQPAARQAAPQSLVALGAPYWTTAGVLTLLLLTLLLFSGEQSEPVIAEATAVPARTRIELPLVTANSQPEFAAAAATEPDVATPALSVTSIGPADELVQAAPAQIPPGQPASSSSEGEEIPVPAVSAPPPAATSIAETDPSGLMSLPAENFTVQIMGSRSEANVQRVIEQQLAAFNASYFETRHQDRPWYVVVTGNFVSRDVAARAIADLPASIRRQDPFIRQISAVQADIKKTLDGQ